MRHQLAFALGCLLLSFTSTGSSLTRQVDRLPDVPSPPQARVEWIAQHMRMNGLPMSLRSFRCPASPDDTLRFYESWWALNGTGRTAQSSRTHASGWEVLALTSSSHHISIQVRPHHTGSEGTITVSPNPRGAYLKVNTRFPLTKTLRVENWQEYEDDGTGAEHITATSHRSVSIEAAALEQELTRSGWTIVRSARSGTDPKNYLLQAQKGRELAQATFHVIANQTKAVIIWKKDQ